MFLASLSPFVKFVHQQGKKEGRTSEITISIFESSARNEDLKMILLMVAVIFFCYLKDIWIVAIMGLLFSLASIVFSATNDGTSIEIAAVVSTWPHCVYLTVCSAPPK